MLGGGALMWMCGDTLYIMSVPMHTSLSWKNEQ